MLIIDRTETGSVDNGHKHHVLTVCEANSDASNDDNLELEQVLSVGQLQGPPFGRRFSDQKKVRLPGHTVQRFAVIESYNLIVAACFSESDESNERPSLLVIDLQTTKVL